MLIRRTAKDIAGAFYEQNRTERFRKAWPDQRAYIAKCWPHFVVTAKDTLLELLRRPSTPQHHKQQIYDAFLEDSRRREQTPLIFQKSVQQTHLGPREHN